MESDQVEEFLFLAKMDLTMMELGKKTVCGDMVDLSHLLHIMKDRYQMEWLMVKEHLRTQSWYIQGNGVAIKGMGKDRKLTNRQEITILEITLMISIMVEDFFNQQISRTLVIFQTEFLMVKEQSNIEMGKLFSESLEMDKE